MLSIKYQIKPETLRQTVISLLHLLHILLHSPLRVHGTPVLPSLEDWQALARAWLTACWCFSSYHTHSTPCTGLGVSDSPCGSALQAAQHHTYKSQRCEKAHFDFVLVKSDTPPPHPKAGWKHVLPLVLKTLPLKLWWCDKVLCVGKHAQNGVAKMATNGHHLTVVVYKYISNKKHIFNPHTITAKTWGLISHTQLVHLVNVKRAVIVNYIPI